MEYLASLISLLFFSLIVIYLYWGIYIIKLNPKSNINRLYLAICIIMSTWSLGFTIANNASTLEQALFWRRISAIGWSAFYSLLVHFLLLLTYKNNRPNKKHSFWFLYIPAFINMYVFAFSNKMAQIQYNLKRFDFGWINISVNNGWDWFFYSYYLVYITISLIIIWKWKRKLKDKKMIKLVNMLVLFFIIALVMGSVIDLVIASVFKKPLPQIGPVFILLPTWVMYYLARYYDVMGRRKFYEDDIIVTDADQENIFKNVAIASAIGGMLIFISEYIPFIYKGNGDLQSGFIKSGLFIILGISIYVFQKIKNKFLKEILTIMVLVLSIPISSFLFINEGSLTVWAFPVIIIMSSLIFSKKSLLIVSTVTAIITQRLFWILKPEVVVIIDQYDYIARIGIFVLIFSIGFYVNKLYVAKIKENKKQIAFQKINSEISLEFVNINQKNFDEKINKLLTIIGLFFKVDRTNLVLIDNKKHTMNYSYVWCKDGVIPDVNAVEEKPLNVFPWWIKELRKNKFVYVEDVNKMPVEANAEQERLIHNKVKSMISVPIDGDNEIQGFIGIDTIVLHKKWTEENIKQLNILSNVMAQGLTKVKDEKRIEFMAYYDDLTKLPNRFLFKDRTDQMIKLAKRNGKFVSVIFIDLDNFKSVNDTIGHKGGDLLLKEAAQRLKSAVRKSDTVARFGGDEFMIMLNDMEDFDNIFKIVDKVMKIFLESFNIQGQDFLITGSAGIAMYPADGEDAETLIKNADTAMYKAKENGKNQYVLCTTEMKEEVKNSVMLLHDLYGALDRKELIVYYQPQLDLLTGKINGLEALLRWKHPKRGIIPPGVFIPLAEKNGLINDIGDWVLKTACIQNKKWQDMNLPHIRMAVNLSAIQLISHNIVNRVEKILKESNLPPRYLELEITESIAIKEATHIEDVLCKLKELGITIAIDDFGTEYSSLSRFKILPIDRIKIDMQFVQGIEINEKDRAITVVIINLAKSLGLNVIAEGVETAVQKDFLSQQLCDDVQGYYYYQPMPTEETEKILMNMV